jgi:hypothetical protein
LRSFGEYLLRPAEALAKVVAESGAPVKEREIDSIKSIAL